MTSSLLVHSLLDSDKLMRPNFDNWYQKLRIVLEHKRILYVIMDPAPKVSDSNADVMVRDTYQKWLNDCMIVYYIMRVAMCDEFNYKFDDAQLKKMLQKLNKFFGTLKDLSSNGHRSSKRRKKRMVQRYHARTSKSNRTNQSKAN